MARSLTPNLAKAVTESGQIVCRIDVIDGRMNILMSTEKTVSAHLFEVVGGSITTDETANVVGTGSIDISLPYDADTRVMPQYNDSPLSPVAKTFLQVRFHAPDDRAQTNYGLYEVVETSINNDAGGLRMTLSIQDLSGHVDRAPFYAPALMLKGTSMARYFALLLDPVLPGLSELHVGSTTHRTGFHVWQPQDSRLEAVNSGAKAIGFRIDWNGTGRGWVYIVDDDMGEPGHNPMWTFTEGGNAQIVSINRVLSQEKSYNGVIAMGENPASGKAPVRAEVWDRNRSSELYYDPANPDASATGPIPYFYVSPYLRTYSQALQAARAQLPKVLGLTERITITARANPGIVPGDSCLLIRPEVAVRKVYFVESVDMPLTVGPMTIRMRERRVFD